jgi:NSS family neurotransmitter:Na+ symporter
MFREKYQLKNYNWFLLLAVVITCSFGVVFINSADSSYTKKQLVGVIVCLGYNLLYFELKLPNSESPGQILDVLDYISNYLMMPIIALATCILIGWVLKPDTVIEEVTKNGEPFRRKKLYTIMTRYISPIFIIVILLFSLGIL